jgi:CRISPR-associated protein Csd1
VSILASLVHAYERLPDAPPFGFSAQKIGFLVSLNGDGSVANVIDLRSEEKRKRLPRMVLVPQPVKRTVGIAPNFLWDKTPYALGVTAGEGKRTADEHAAFITRHTEALSGTADEGLQALLSFLAGWTPDQFVGPLWPEDMKDQNLIFALESERRQSIYLHDRPAAKALWARLNAADGKPTAICLVTGEQAPIARLHPSIKGVWGAQSAGSSLVSFNLDAFTSYGHEQGDNAPVSEQAAAAYTTVLNRFLETDSKHRVQIGDASTIYWADGSDAKTNEAAEGCFSAFVSDFDEAMEAKKIGDLLAKIRSGRPVREFDPELATGVRFHVLGLAPNAARLSIRFYFASTFGKLAENYQSFLSDMRIAPPPRDPYPALWKYLAETAVLGKRENVPPNLAGEWMRAILTGTRYPLTLLSTILMRLRADKTVNGLRIAMLKAVLIRNFEREVPVAFDPENRNKGYVLGRLFATYEQIQSAALGSKVNATVRDKFYGAASAQPRKVFALLGAASTSHLAKVGKQKPGYRVNLEKTVADIMGLMQPGDDPFPASFSAEEQALFGVGYYHQRSEFFKPRVDEPTLPKDSTS